MVWIQVLAAALAVLVLGIVIASALWWPRPGEQTTVAGRGTAAVLLLLGLALVGAAALVVVAPVDAPARLARWVPHLSVVALLVVVGAFAVWWRQRGRPQPR